MSREPGAVQSRGRTEPPPAQRHALSRHTAHHPPPRPYPRTRPTQSPTSPWVAPVAGTRTGESATPGGRAARGDEGAAAPLRPSASCDAAPRKGRGRTPPVCAPRVAPRPHPTSRPAIAAHAATGRAGEVDRTHAAARVLLQGLGSRARIRWVDLVTRPIRTPCGSATSARPRRPSPSIAPVPCGAHA